MAVWAVMDFPDGGAVPFMFLLFGAARTVLLDNAAAANPEFFPLRRTVDRLVNWCQQRSVSYLLGCHIEMSTKPEAQMIIMPGG